MKIRKLFCLNHHMMPYKKVIYPVYKKPGIKKEGHIWKCTKCGKEEFHE